MAPKRTLPAGTGAGAVSYRRIDHRQHVLLRPGMYVGSVEADSCAAWLFDGARMASRTVSYVPALLKIFDEILMNAIDHSVRLRELKKEAAAAAPDAVQVVRNIRVGIDRATGWIEVTNDGEGIDVTHHMEDGQPSVYIPELIFGHLLTSANYDDAPAEVPPSAPAAEAADPDTGGGGGKRKKARTGEGDGAAAVGGRIVGGQNGIGAKACNIFSKEFRLETVDRHRRLLYTQTFRDNMTAVTAPVIKSCARKHAYTTIRFLPDYARFGLEGGLSEDMHALLVKRVYDATAVTDTDVAVHLNGAKVECKSFERYVDLYLGPPPSARPSLQQQQQQDGGGGGGGAGTERVYERINDWWEVAASCSEGDGLQQVSFVNGTWTIRGGKHVDHIVGQIVRKLTHMIAEKRGKDGAAVAASLKPQFIRDNLFVFVKATIPNPTFDSQSKETLTTPVSRFGSPPAAAGTAGGAGVEVSDRFVERLYKTALVGRVLALSEASADRSLKKTDGRKQSTISGIPKLEDANWAGGAKSRQCTLILTEGDSAKTMALAGLDQAARDRYGVFPLRGKVMNVCDTPSHRIAENTEIKHLKTILGLESGRTYTDAGDLRYGRIMIMTDQDVDGSHIKGLLFNLFYQLWPSLLKVDGFLTSLLTPIVKATPRRGAGPVLSFYNMGDYHEWVRGPGAGAGGGHDIKYYKGLGTSTSAEAKQYFRDLKMANYRWTGEVSRDAIDLAFNKVRANDRKRWLMAYDKARGLDFGLADVPFPDFVHKDLIHFSNYDLVRSIPSVCDGLKVSQRKIMFACFKRNLVQQVKVAQLAGYVSEKAAYHHGEASLNATIVGLAQDFVGANNVNLLQPIGQFGSRLMGGKDCSASRYIFTAFNPLTPLLFMREDDPVLTYLDDDGFPVEPEHYVPILPMALVNGATGIGTGFSTNVPSYNPEDLVRLVRRCLDAPGDPAQECDVSGLLPWARGFTGEILRISAPPTEEADDGEEASSTASLSVRQRGGAGERFCSRGRVQRTKPTEAHVSELPLGYWTHDFKEHLEAVKQRMPELRAVRHNHTDTTVSCTLVFASAAALDALLVVLPATATQPEMTRLERELKMVTTRGLTTQNMYLFNREGRIQKYDGIRDIVLEHFAVRLEAYASRKRLLLETLAAREGLLDDKIRFLQAVVDGRVEVQKRSKADLEGQLLEMGFAPRPPPSSSSGSRTGDGGGDGDGGAEEGGGGDGGAGTAAGAFDHLIKMPIYTLTLDKKRELEAQLEATRLKTAELRDTSEKAMWHRDLDAFEAACQGKRR